VDITNDQTDGFALKSNVRQIIEIDTEIAIIQKTETETETDTMTPTPTSTF